MKTKGAALKKLPSLSVMEDKTTMINPPKCPQKSSLCPVPMIDLVDQIIWSDESMFI